MYEEGGGGNQNTNRKLMKQLDIFSDALKKSFCGPVSFSRVFCACFICGGARLGGVWWSPVSLATESAVHGSMAARPGMRGSVMGISRIGRGNGVKANPVRE